MAAVYTVGQVLGSGATVTADAFVTLADGTTVETMDAVYPNGAHDHAVITTPGTGSGSVNFATIQQRAQAALSANATYLALVSPTTAQAVAQVATLTKESNGIIRLLLGLLDSTTGT